MPPLSLAIITAAILAVTPVRSVSHNDVVHLGCFKTNLVDTQRSYYMVDEPLSWENGISACIHRYTTHVGVQADNWMPSLSNFFCGNDLLEHSVKLEDSACAPCVIPSDKHCGGPQSWTLYQIRDSTPLVIFLATLDGISLVEFDGAHANASSLILTPTGSSRIDLFHPKDEILFQQYTDESLYNSFYGRQTEKYGRPSKIKVNSTFAGLAVDWIHERLYFCERRSVMEYDMLKKHTKQLYNADSDCYDLAIDPYNRTLFNVFWNGTLSSYSLLTKNMHIYKGGEFNLQSVWRVALDYESQLIYVVASLTEADSALCLVTFDYDDTAPTLLYQGPYLNFPDSLDVFKDSVVWDDFSDSKDTIYVCKMSPTCEQDDIKVIHSTSHDVRDIVIYHPIKQTPTERHLCKALGCTHGCSRAAMFTAQCTCPEGFILGTDNATCQVSAETYCANVEVWQAGRQVNRQRIMSSDRDEDQPGPGSCKWESPPQNGFNFRPCSERMCSDKQGLHKRNCTLRFTRCDPSYVLVGGRERDTCVNGRWTSRGHQCIPCGRSLNNDSSSDRILQGHVSFKGFFPWMAALYYKMDGFNWEQICGGSLISPSLVLTAAHCTVLGSHRFKAEDVRVGLGKLKSSIKEQEEFSIISFVKEIVRPDRYRGVDHLYELDMALFVLSSSVVTGEYIMPVCMDWAAAMEPKHNEEGYLAGYGKTEQDTPSPVLKWTTQKFVQYNSCVTLMKPKEVKLITQDKFCGALVDGGMADKGDSGGGFTMVRDRAHYVYGVLSTKLSSTSENVRLFTNVLNAGHLDWLTKEWQRLLVS